MAQGQPEEDYPTQSKIALNAGGESFHPLFFTPYAKT